MAVRTRGRKVGIDLRVNLPDGRRVRCFETKDVPQDLKQAKRMERAIEHHKKMRSFRYLDFFPNGSKAQHFRVTVSSITYEDWTDQYFSLKSLGTQAEYNQWNQYTKRIFPQLGHMPIAAISQDDILAFRKVMQNEGLKGSSINTIMKYICQPFRAAVERGVIPRSPCDGIKSLREAEPKIQPFTFDELRHFLSKVEKHDQPFHDMMLFWSRTGLRPGEIYALRWENIDLFNGKALVRETRHQIGGRVDIPKTDSSNRAVDLRPPVLAALKRQKAVSAVQKRWVWLNPHGNQWTAYMMSQRFRHFLTMAGLPYRPAKNMRHTFATLHIAAGESITWVSRMLGHSDVQITLKRYNRFIPNLTRDDGSAFEKQMERKNQAVL